MLLRTAIDVLVDKWRDGGDWIMTVFDTATPGSIPTWSIGVSVSGQPLSVTANGKTHKNLSHVTLRITTAPPIRNTRLHVDNRLVNPVGDQAWTMAFAPFISGFQLDTDSNGIRQVPVSVQQLFSSVVIGTSTNPVGSGTMDFKVWAGSVVEFQIQIEKVL